VTRYLLAAEADKIQDLIFRSARLREVVGGSQLLTRFCREIPELLEVPEGDIIISDGGSFRILFDSREQANSFGERLAEVYRLATGGSLTVAKVVEVNDDFGAASEQSEENLRRAKRWCEAWQIQEHLPYMAFCASCGVGLVVAHRAYHQDEEEQYLCASCLNKGAERSVGEMGPFLRDFYQEVVGKAGLDQADWPGKKKRKGRTEIDPLEDAADYDTRRYVAYLLADGNDMGKVFRACRRKPDQMRALSKGLTQSVCKALAEPTRLAMTERHHMRDRPDFIPVLPLILGGDDLFALIPAPWSLDFVHRFCRVYEREMAALFERIGLDDVPRPTVSAAVVICKSKHPYTLAHEAGERRLREAKRTGKRLVLDGGQPASTINLEVVLGGRLVTSPVDKKIRPTLRPYWAADGVSSDWGLSVQQLIEQRLELCGIPRKRLAELRSLYDLENLPAALSSDDFPHWKARLERLLARIGRSEEHGKVVKKALTLLGGDESAYWRKVERYPEEPWHGHGLPDLLEAWDFALNLGKSRPEYEEERR
jgi:hypothetical protein